MIKIIKILAFFISIFLLPVLYANNPDNIVLNTGEIASRAREIDLNKQVLTGNGVVTQNPLFLIKNNYKNLNKNQYFRNKNYEKHIFNLPESKTMDKIIIEINSRDKKELIKSNFGRAKEYLSDLKPGSKKHSPFSGHILKVYWPYRALVGRWHRETVGKIAIAMWSWQENSKESEKGVIFAICQNIKKCGDLREQDWLLVRLPKYQIHWQRVSNLLALRGKCLVNECQWQVKLL